MSSKYIKPKDIIILEIKMWASRIFIHVLFKIEIVLRNPKKNNAFQLGEDIVARIVEKTDFQSNNYITNEHLLIN